MNLYILKCKDNKYYVGTTTLDTTKRLTQHMSGRGSAWTKKYPPLWIEKELKNCDKYDEDKWTKIYMDRYGINNVRGGAYSQISLPNNEVNLLEREVNHANQKCLFCGKQGHFIKQCPSKKSINTKYLSKNLHYLNMSCDYESADERIYWDAVESESESESESEDDWEYSPHENVGARDGTIYDSEKGYIRPKTNKSSKGSCYRCGRKGHYSSTCYAKKHIKGHYLKN